MSTAWNALQQILTSSMVVSIPADQKMAVSAAALRVVRSLSALLPITLSAAHAKDELPLPPTARPLVMSPVERSLSELLQDGYDIVAVDAGIAGTAYVLKKKRDFIFCSMGLYGPASKAKPYSDCEHLDRSEK